MKRKITILLVLSLILTQFMSVSKNFAAIMPTLAYQSKVLYIGGDKLGKYPNDSCIVPIRNAKGYQVSYEVTSGKDLATVSNTGKVQLTNKGIGTAVVTITYSKTGEKQITNTFKVYVRRNAKDVRLTKASEQKLKQAIKIGDKITLAAEKSYDGTYEKGHYGTGNYKGVVSDNLVIESYNPEIITANGLTLTAVSEGVAEIVVKAYQIGQNQFTGVKSQTYTVVVTSNNGISVAAHSEIKSNIVSSGFARWKSTVRDYMYVNQDNTINIVEALEDKLVIETYNEKNQLVSTKVIKNELPLFGAYYSGKEYNYIAFGQTNKEEDDKKEVIRIVKYDKNFNKVGAVSITGGMCYTITPFDAAAGRMAESFETDQLILHTSRTRYTSSDGLNHQSQLTIEIDTKNMTVLNDLGLFQSNHVSHSFDQYVLFDNGQQVLVDHGDAYPRSIVISKVNDFSSYDRQRYEKVDAYEIPGTIGANCTGVSIGGFEITDSNYMIAMNTIDHSLVTQYTSYEMVGLPIDQRDVLLCVIPKDSFNDESVKHVVLGKYVGSDKIASIPKLVKINNDKFMVLWQEFSTETRKIGDVKYVLIDGNGNKIGKVETVKQAKLSNCNPIVKGNEVIWYANDEGARYLFSIGFGN